MKRCLDKSPLQAILEFGCCSWRTTAVRDVQQHAAISVISYPPHDPYPHRTPGDVPNMCPDDHRTVDTLSFWWWSRKSGYCIHAVHSPAMFVALRRCTLRRVQFSGVSKSRGRAFKREFGRLPLTRSVGMMFAVLPISNPLLWFTF